uniref:Kinesin light chain n=1 Tax=Grammatophora oceanica TaxID=210454 RepID=A0A7S1UNU7_9STRA
MMYAGKYNQSLAYFQHAVDIRSTTLGPEHPETNASLTKIGMLQASNGDFHNALATFSQILRGRRRAHGYNHVEAAKALNNVACVDYECGGLVSAQKSLEEAIDILEKNAFSSPLDKASIDSSLIQVKNNMAFLLYKRGRFQESKQYYEQVAELQEKWNYPVEDFATTQGNIRFVEEDLDRSSPKQSSFASTSQKSKSNSTADVVTTTADQGSSITPISDRTAPVDVNTRLEEAFEFIAKNAALMKLTGCA